MCDVNKLGLKVRIDWVDRCTYALGGMTSIRRYYKVDPEESGHWW